MKYYSNNNQAGYKVNVVTTIPCEVSIRNDWVGNDATGLIDQIKVEIMTDNEDDYRYYTCDFTQSPSYLQSLDDREFEELGNEVIEDADLLFASLVEYLDSESSKNDDVIDISSLENWLVSNGFEQQN